MRRTLKFNVKVFYVVGKKLLMTCFLARIRLRRGQNNKAKSRSYLFLFFIKHIHIKKFTRFGTKDACLFGSSLGIPYF